MKPLSYPSQRLLSRVQESPGLSRSKLAALLYPEMNPYYSVPRVTRMVKQLEVRGLLELGEGLPGEKAGVRGVYPPNYKKSESGYVGIFGRVL